MEQAVTLDPPLSETLPEADLLFDASLDLLAEYHAWTQEFLETVRPDLRLHLERWLSDHAPTSGQALLTLLERFPAASREPCGPECILA
jgi:hypothetical protein